MFFCFDVLPGLTVETEPTGLESNLAFEFFNISTGFRGVHVGREQCNL